MIDPANIEQTVIACARNWAPNGTNIVPESRLVEDLGFDSLDEIEFAMELEDMFEIDLTDADLEAAKTIGAAVEMVRQKVAA